MPIESEADRLEYLRAFGLCIQTDRGTLQGIFDREGQPTTLGDATIIAEGPQAIVRTADVVRLGLQRGDGMVIDGRGYRSVEIRRDGTGMTTLRLEEI